MTPQSFRNYVCLRYPGLHYTKVPGMDYFVIEKPLDDYDNARFKLTPTPAGDKYFVFPGASGNPGYQPHPYTASADKPLPAYWQALQALLRRTMADDIVPIDIRKAIREAYDRKVVRTGTPENVLLSVINATYSRRVDARPNPDVRDEYWSRSGRFYIISLPVHVMRACRHLNGRKMDKVFMYTVYDSNARGETGESTEAQPETCFIASIISMAQPLYKTVRPDVLALTGLHPGDSHEAAIAMLGRVYALDEVQQKALSKGIGRLLADVDGVCPAQGGDGGPEPEPEPEPSRAF